ncbi:hypothetical protein KDD17_04690 [Sulfitobacter albidus]|uniref:Glyoxalase-related protein domain-containing protein n=1 Tax=Sulfitobacter albidus TaxID=2829501 RepID=A0A975JF11_9RHOB|nr:glyoxalase superfamily protein [Sulfitobacter albidus]QUJ77309.1 hypothetical protein KDD17_04690 [Sulfitobacter albidus]
MTPPLPPRDALKRQAKALRADLAAQGTTMTHAASLETVAHQWGMRDWNTLAAKSEATATVWHPAQRVKGTYLGHPFTGTLKAAQMNAGGFWRVTVRFDVPIDVVSSDQFSALRRQVNATLTADGRTVETISTGVPHMELHPA